MLACVTSVFQSLMFLSPVLIMVGFVLFAKLRQRGMEPLAETPDAPSSPVFERELEPVS